MLDRASTFADKDIVHLLKTAFVPVAIDQAYQRRQKDTEGEFYRKIAGQSPRSDFRRTTQGFYIATAGGELLLYNNNRNPARLRRLMNEKLAAFRSSRASKEVTPEIHSERQDPKYVVSPPKGGLVARVHTKVLSGHEPTTDRWKTIFNSALGRDNLWVSQSEHRALVRGEIAKSLQVRIARFHLVDNTRGEPPMWREDEIRTLEFRLEGDRLSGRVSLRTDKGDRAYDASLLGRLETKAGKVTRFDLVVRGKFRGEGRWTPGAPKGPFSLAVSFRLADFSEPADSIPPQASRGSVREYIR